MTLWRQVSEDSNILVSYLRALSDAEIQRRLQLTDAQSQQIRTILKDGFQQGKPFREALADVQRSIVEKAVAVLTDEQRSQWEHLQDRGYEIEQQNEQFANRPYQVIGNRASTRWRRYGDPGMNRGPGLGWQRPIDSPDYVEPTTTLVLQKDTEPECTGAASIDLPLKGSATSIRTIEAKEFREITFDRLAPLLIRGAAARAAQRWTDEWLTNRFDSGDCQISLDSRPASGGLSKDMPLSKYLESLAGSSESGRWREYLFHTQRDPQGAADLLEDLDVPTAILNLGEPTLYRLFVGPALSGTLPHNHTYAINALARGRKRWAIYVSANPGITDALLRQSYWDYGDGAQAQEWFIQECPRLRTRRRVQLWEFIQEAGDLVYVPASFIHAVVNLEPVVGFSVEFLPERGFAPGRRTRRAGLRRR
jgi:hypothetical protein